MEIGGDISSGFNVVDKKSLSNSDFVTWTKLQIGTEALMGASCIHHRGSNLDRPFVGDDDDDGGGGGGGGVGPTNNSGGANEVGCNILYRDGVSYSGAGGGNFGQTFNIFPSTTISYTPQGGVMGFPFTAAQLKELERQALIYKYMISSVPVPLHLLPQLSRNFPAAASLSSIYSSGRYSKNGDPEPGRCKRTDGKKWRCSKEVAPQQKYCERHLHRGRPRSRKPVEAAAAAKENHKKKSLQSTSANEPLSLLNAKTDLTISTPPYYNYNREGKIVAPWESIMKSNCYIPQEYVEEQQPLDAFCYPNILIDSRNLKPSMNDGDLSPSLNLSMAMAAGNIVDREMRSIQMSNNVEDRKTKDSTWLNPGPFLGPLGEVLAVGGSTPASPYNSISTPATSPSGVLHWTLFSQSDSSVCSSPTFVAPPSEGSNQWHNQ
ncbi:hypothetical protein ACS0TY_010620 [Phlomoides rotata]